MSTNYKNNDKTVPVPNVVIHTGGEWGSEERGVTMAGEQEELVLQCSLAEMKELEAKISRLQS